MPPPNRYLRRARAAPLTRRAPALAGDADSQPSPVRAVAWLRQMYPWLGELMLTVAALGATLYVSLLVSVDASATFRRLLEQGRTAAAFEFGLLCSVLFALTYAMLVYLVARLAYFVRLSRMAKQPSPASAMRTGSQLTVLVPSYREEKALVWRTLVSAAMIEHPDRRAVLLVDDPPNAGNHEERLSLAQARALAGEVDELFAAIARRISSEIRGLRADAEPAQKAQLAVRLYETSALFLEQLAGDVAADVYGGPADHTRAFFVQKILREPAAEYRKRADVLRSDAGALDGDLERLGTLFKTRIEFFERKLYANMPKAADKATNLNAYLSLMGRSFVKQSREDGTHLIDVRSSTLNGSDELLVFGDADYVLILDADSIVFPCYAKTLLGIMESKGHERVGVAQTPYLAFPGATSLLERVAGATTDIQFIVHQGMGGLGAGFWVGANALVRMKAFRDIAAPAEENGHRYYKFVQDRTVIEDTGSSLDLRQRGWTIHNHVAGLSYSATPPDFGSLLIQRRRWANGGLILIPDLLRCLRGARFSLGVVPEALMRLHYLTSQALVSLSVLALLVYPFDYYSVGRLLPLTTLPYFLVYGRDLKRAGYNWSDLARVYVLNLILLPVILGGVAKSIHQIVTGKKTPFARTPKIEGRTATPAFYLLMELGLLAWVLLVLGQHLLRNDVAHVIFPTITALASIYGCVALVGVRPLLEDIGLGFSLPNLGRLVRTAAPVHATGREGQGEP